MKCPFSSRGGAVPPRTPRELSRTGGRLRARISRGGSACARSEGRRGRLFAEDVNCRGPEEDAIQVCLLCRSQKLQTRETPSPVSFRARTGPGRGRLRESRKINDFVPPERTGKNWESKYLRLVLTFRSSLVNISSHTEYF